MRNWSRTVYQLNNTAWRLFDDDAINFYWRKQNRGIYVLRRYATKLLKADEI